MFLSVIIKSEYKQALDIMKYSHNHPWKFGIWFLPFFLAAVQFFFVFFLEAFSMFLLLSAQTPIDSIANFIALMIIADFDVFLFAATQPTPMCSLISDGEIVLDGITITLDAFVSIETTTSRKYEYTA